MKVKFDWMQCSVNKILNLKNDVSIVTIERTDIFKSIWRTYNTYVGVVNVKIITKTITLIKIALASHFL